MSEIVDGLYLGSVWLAEDNEWLMEHQITHVLSICAKEQLPEESFYEELKISHMLHDVADEYDTNLLPLFPETCHFITSAVMKEGCKVLVHCTAGVSRSSTLVCAYIMQSQGLNTKDAIDFVRSKRQKIHPNLSFQMQLEAWLMGKFSVGENENLVEKAIMKEISTIREDILQLLHNVKQRSENNDEDYFQFQRLCKTVYEFRLGKAEDIYQLFVMLGNEDFSERGLTISSSYKHHIRHLQELSLINSGDEEEEVVSR